MEVGALLFATRGLWVTQLGVVSVAGDGPDPRCVAFVTQSWEHRPGRIVLHYPLEVSVVE